MNPAPLTLRRMVRWLWIPVALAIVLGVAGYLREAHKPNRYTATGKLLFDQTSPYLSLLGYTNNVSSEDAGSLAATNIALTTLPVLTGQALSRLPTAFRSGTSFSASAVGTSDLVDVSATSASPAAATRASNAYLDTFVVYEQRVIHRQTLSAAMSLSRQISREQTQGVASADLTTVRGTLAQLPTRPTTNYSGVSSAQPAQTAPRTGPHKTKEAVLAAIIGLIAGLLGVFVITRLDSRTGNGDGIDLWGASRLDVNGPAARSTGGLAASVALQRVVTSLPDIAGPQVIVVSTIDSTRQYRGEVARALAETAARTFVGRVAVLNLAASTKIGSATGASGAGGTSRVEDLSGTAAASGAELVSAPHRSELDEFEVVVFAVDAGADPATTAALLARAHATVILGSTSTSRVRIQSLIEEIAHLGDGRRFFLLLDRAGAKSLLNAEQRLRTSPAAA